MPKIINGLRETLIEQSRELLIQSGYNAVTIRSVAARCGVAVGTVYNYFESKEMLIAMVMLVDWRHTLEEMRSDTSAAQALRDGIKGMFAAVAAFRRIYTTAWSQYSAGGGDTSMLRERHSQLVGQLAGLLDALGARFGLSPEPVCLEVAAEVLLGRARDGVDFDQICPALIKLLS